MAKKEKHCRKIKKDLSIENIKEVNEKVEKKAKGFWADFKKFVAKGNIIDLAVAVVVGTAFNKVVNALVTNIITPLTSRILPKGDFSMLKIVLEPAVEADPENGIAAVEEVAVTYGAFFETLLDFLIIALTIYVVMKVFLKLKNTIHRREIEAAEARAKALEEKKKREAEEEHARQEKIKNDFLEDVSVQADVLNDIKEIMLRMEKRQSGLGGD